MAVTMQSHDSHANNRFNNSKQQFMHNKPQQNNSADNQKFQKKNKPKWVIECYNCNEEGHRYTKCPKPFDPVVFGANFKKAQERQQEYDSKKSGKN